IRQVTPAFSFWRGSSGGGCRLERLIENREEIVVPLAAPDFVVLLEKWGKRSGVQAFPDKCKGFCVSQKSGSGTFSALS
ncbi:MAG: hypothetical protein ABI871_01280, partial [Chthoniobacterales bacterium]